MQLRNPVASFLLAASGSHSIYYDEFSRRAEVLSAPMASDGKIQLQSRLDDLMLDCHLAGWDGHNAEAVSFHAYSAAARFIMALPLGFELPSISADSDGCVTFEWRKSVRRILLVSVHPDYRLDYAAIFGAAKSYGSEPFFGDRLPDTIRHLAQRVFSV